MENTNSMANIMNLMKLFAPSSTPKATSTNEEAWPMFPIDEKIHTEPLRICKCLIPYLPFEKQRDISILIKAFELVSVADHFAKLEESDTTSLSLKRSETWQTDLLSSIRNNLDPKNAYLVDIFFKINDVKDILATAQSSSQSPPAAEQVAQVNPSQDFANNIAPNLNDNQKKILDVLSTVMK